MLIMNTMCDEMGLEKKEYTEITKNRVKVQDECRVGLGLAVQYVSETHFNLEPWALVWSVCDEARGPCVPPRAVI